MLVGEWLCDSTVMRKDKSNRGIMKRERLENLEE